MPKVWSINIILCFLFLNSIVLVYPQNPEVSYEQLQQTYIPQSSPKETFELELKLLSQGAYCYDLPMFDSAWRKKGKEISYNSRYAETAEKFDTSFKVYKQGKYAVIYFPNDKSLGPEFLYRDYSGWILDRTSVWNNIHYNQTNSGWFAYEGDYPYLDILKKIFQLEKIKLDNGVAAYQIKE